MNRLTPLAAVALLLLVPAATAGSFSDAQGDTDVAAWDVLRLDWQVDTGTITVNWTLAAAPVANASYTAVVYIGAPNASEPEEGYVVHHGPGGDRVLTTHTDPARQIAPSATLNGTRMSFTFDRVQPSDSSCNFAVATTSTFDGGQRVHDSVPDEDIDPAQAWRAGAYCLIDPIKDRIRDGLNDLQDQTGIPGPGPVALVGALAFAFAARRR